MEWSYGVTTVESRIDNLLVKTLASLAAAGFPGPHIFIDGLPVPPSSLSQYRCTCHYPNLRTANNWVLSAYELYLRNTHADRYAIFQDDILAYKNLRDYLEWCEYPRKGYLNLYTFPENTRKDSTGWYESNQRGKGAVALIFNREAIQTILASRYIVDRPVDLNKGHKSIDGGIISAYRKIGWKEYVHNPSLVQHIGEISSMGNGRHPSAPTWRGEEYDARELIP